MITWFCMSDGDAIPVYMNTPDTIAMGQSDGSCQSVLISGPCVLLMNSSFHVSQMADVRLF